MAPGDGRATRGEGGDGLGGSHSSSLLLFFLCFWRSDWTGSDHVWSRLLIPPLVSQSRGHTQDTISEKTSGFLFL